VFSGVFTVEEVDGEWDNTRRDNTTVDALSWRPG